MSEFPPYLHADMRMHQQPESKHLASHSSHLFHGELAHLVQASLPCFPNSDPALKLTVFCFFAVADVLCVFPGERQRRTDRRIRAARSGGRPPHEIGQQLPRQGGSRGSLAGEGQRKESACCCPPSGAAMSFVFHRNACLPTAHCAAPESYLWPLVCVILKYSCTFAAAAFSTNRSCCRMPTCRWARRRF